MTNFISLQKRLQKTSFLGTEWPKVMKNMNTYVNKIHQNKQNKIKKLWSSIV